MRKKPFIPASLTLQWHVTERCNWRCRHCYQENFNTPELNLAEMKKVLEQFSGLIKKWQIPKKRAFLNITGGEPFIRKDFFDFLKEVANYSESFNWTVMSNGSLIDRAAAQNLRKLGIESVQVSLEGCEKTNDEIRGSGSFQKTLRAIKILREEHIPVRVSLTLSKQNHSEIEELAGILARSGASLLAARRIVPLGTAGSQLKNQLLQPFELRDIYRQMESINKKMIEKNISFRVFGGCENAIFNNEISARGLMSAALCGVADGRVLVLLPDGQVLICRRLPIVLGNIKEASFEQMYYSQKYENLREGKDASLECFFCPNFTNCLGGAKCVTYALTKKTSPDMQCWKLFDSLEESARFFNSSLGLKLKIIWRSVYFFNSSPVPKLKIIWRQLKNIF